MDLGVIGNITLDIVAGVDRLPTPGKTGLIKNSKVYFGGRGANVAVLAAKLGLTVGLVSFVGDDFPEKYREHFETSNVDMSRVIFRLKRWWPPKADRKNQVELFEEIKSGRKTSEWRKATKFWRQRLLDNPDISLPESTKSIKRHLKVNMAWFTVGFPKDNVPRLEADITDIIWHPSREFEFEIRFKYREE